MKITNIHNWPDTLVNLLTRDSYTKGKADYSITELISPPRITVLRRKYAKEIEIDISDRLWALLGRTMHKVCETGAGETHVVEQRLYGEVAGCRISGGIDVQDHLADGTVAIDDYKFVSVMAAGMDKPEWEIQTNLYAWLVRLNTDKVVSRLRIICILRDWLRSKAINAAPLRHSSQRSSSRRTSTQLNDYPLSAIKIINIPIWSNEECEKYLKRRIAIHQVARMADQQSVELPECSSEEMWERPEKWSVQKPGAKRASRVLDTEAEAKTLARQQNMVVVHRPGERPRCQSYCEVSQWCSQYKQWREKYEKEYGASGTTGGTTGGAGRGGEIDPGSGEVAGEVAGNSE